MCRAGILWRGTAMAGAAPRGRSVWPTSGTPAAPYAWDRGQEATAIRAHAGDVPAHDAVWVVDVTFLPTRAGWLHLAALLDLHKRQIVSWAMGERADQTLVSAALRMALDSRRPASGAIYHSAPQRRLSGRAQGSRPAAEHEPQGDAVRQCGDGKLFSSLKQELTHHVRFADLDEARCKLFDYIKVFYSSLGYRTPVEQERQASA
jgi:putative transposase